MSSWNDFFSNCTLSVPSDGFVVYVTDIWIPGLHTFCYPGSLLQRLGEWPYHKNRILLSRHTWSIYHFTCFIGPLWLCNPGVTDADLRHIKSMDLGKLSPDTDTVTWSLSHLKWADIDGCAYLSVSARAEQCHCPMGSWVAIQPLAGDLLAALVVGMTLRSPMSHLWTPLSSALPRSCSRRRVMVTKKSGESGRSTAVLEGLVNTG